MNMQINNQLIIQAEYQFNSHSRSGVGEKFKSKAKAEFLAETLTYKERLAEIGSLLIFAIKRIIIKENQK